MAVLRLIVNARIATGDPHRPWVDALVLDGMTPVTVGSSAELRKRYDASAQVIDAKGAVVDPTAPLALLRLIDADEGVD